ESTKAGPQEDGLPAETTRRAPTSDRASTPIFPHRNSLAILFSVRKQPVSRAPETLEERAAASAEPEPAVQSAQAEGPAERLAASCRSDLGAARPISPFARTVGQTAQFLDNRDGVCFAAPNAAGAWPADSR